MGNISLAKNIIKNSVKLKHQITVIKLSSKIIQDNHKLKNFAENIKLLAICGIRIFIVHDYGDLIYQTKKYFNIGAEHYLSEISPDKSLEIAEMILSGNVNKRITHALSLQDIQTIGISGRDSNLITATKFKTKIDDLNIRDNTDIYNYVNIPKAINTEVLFALEEANLLPIISPIACDEDNNIRVVDANYAASMIATSVGGHHLVLFSNKHLPADKCYYHINNNNDLQRIATEFNQPLQYSSILKSAQFALNQQLSMIHLIDANQQDNLLLSFLNLNKDISKK